MAGSFADYLENKLLDHAFGGPDYTRPVTVYAALYTAAPSDTGGGTEVGTGTWTNYARIAITNNATNFPAAAAGAKSNGTAISWPAATASGAVSVVAAAILDASTAGNFMAWADLTTSPKVVNNGDTPSFAAGDLDLTLT